MKLRLPISKVRLRFRPAEPQPQHSEDWQACMYDFHCNKCGGARCRNNRYHDRVEALIYPVPDERRRCQDEQPARTAPQRRVG
jgi:hypothetical protein